MCFTAGMFQGFAAKTSQLILLNFPVQLKIGGKMKASKGATNLTLFGAAIFLTSLPIREHFTTFVSLQNEDHRYKNTQTLH